MAQQIAATAPKGGEFSQFVRLIVPAEAEQPYRLEFAGTSLYRGYDLRSLTPRAVTQQYDLPLTDAPTSAREAVEALARQQAAMQGALVAVRCDTRKASNAILVSKPFVPQGWNSSNIPSNAPNCPVSTSCFTSITAA